MIVNLVLDRPLQGFALPRTDTNLIEVSLAKFFMVSLLIRGQYFVATLILQPDLRQLLIELHHIGAEGQTDEVFILFGRPALPGHCIGEFHKRRGNWTLSKAQRLTRVKLFVLLRVSFGPPVDGPSVDASFEEIAEGSPGSNVYSRSVGTVFRSGGSILSSNPIAFFQLSSIASNDGAAHGYLIA